MSISKEIRNLFSEDMPLSIYMSPSRKRPKRATTLRKKRTTKNTRQFFINVEDTKSERTLRSKDTSSETSVILLDDDEIVNNVTSKIDNFMKSGNLVSSDEDEVEPKPKVKQKSLYIAISDDSDDEYKPARSCVNLTSNFNPGPSTSSNTSTNIKTKRDVAQDVVAFIESVLDSDDSEKIDNFEDKFSALKNLDEFRKETQEILDNASSLYNEIKAAKKKTEPESKPKVDPNTPKVGIDCPVCLESLSNRPAAVTVCGHIFCKECITQTAKTLKHCPTCRKPVNLKKIHPIYL